MKRFHLFIRFFSLIFILGATLTGCAGLESDRRPASDDDYSKYYDEDNNENDDTAPLDRCGKACLRSKGEDQDRSISTTGIEDRRVRQAIDTKDVILGMTRSQVLQSWGDPSLRELAGQGGDGHERWRYGNKLTLQGERVLIFENGHVAGWYR